MKLQFKEQQFQIDAVKAVVDCFAGQPIKTNRFTLVQIPVKLTTQFRFKVTT